MFFGTGDPEHNSTAPRGELAGSGWQWEGTWSVFLGTAIGPRHFLTASHVGGAVSNVFTYRGKSYLARAVSHAPNADLAVWRVAGVFPEFAPLYSGTNEPGQACVVMGRGTQRGAPFNLEIEGTNQLRGWYWGAADARQRWGENVIAEVVDGGPGIGDVLSAGFDEAGLPDECHLSSGDSGGGLFIRGDTGWQLAGINYAVDGPFSLTGTNGDRGFMAALVDTGGLYVTPDGTNWVSVPQQATPQPSLLYATRVSPNAAWIQSVLAQPLPEDERLVPQIASSPEGPYTDLEAYELDESIRTLRIETPSQPSYYRLRSCFAATITRIQVEGARLVLEFE